MSDSKTAGTADPLLWATTTASIDGREVPGVLILRLRGKVSLPAMSSFVDAHNAAIDALDGSKYTVFCDVQDLSPLSPQAAAEFERAKKYSSEQLHFLGSAVLVTSQIVALQHERTSVSGGVMATEIITHDANEAWAHLEKLRALE